MRIAITGATGLLGRNLLFEIIKRNISRLDDLELLILSRSYESSPLNDRIKNIFFDDGFDYIGIEENKRSMFFKRLMKSIVTIPFDLAKDDLSITSQDYKTLSTKRIDCLFHVAAMTDFRSDAVVKSALDRVNIKGTQKILELIKSINVKQLVYVGSAYSCGSRVGVVNADYINPDEIFRNPYEESKLKAEILVRGFAKHNNIILKIFRPSTICGRLIEKPIGRVNKFDVFYAWAAFFLRLKIKQGISLDQLYTHSIDMPIRLHFNPKGGLNIVPADYSAKLIYGVTFDNDFSGSYHVANNKQTPNRLYGDTTFEVLNVRGYSYVLEEPLQKSKIEEMYYRTVGKIFTPYGISDEIVFNREGINEYEQKSGLTCPFVDRENFLKLLDYAKSKYFGLVELASRK
ncbi:MAG: SDR family oxidoreductase [Candidatus Margulisbacteria bacterium]|nr:SDR family oxidoreductase [Candidatus Margulisiibacteriota bacterium]